ncbi:YjgF-like translation initiation inhibitor [Paenibacillus sp. FSL H8-0548]|uniref:RidA family protein n=1 Tax=Paenibacillus sp. FSL H8-0548 TaxID=1920422 RepID=UPI00096D5291|nr:Rid family hydrolase [Paenibacillus sp. FSL H8-0548]OMF29063.1 YjgF-like translation initiation inhibitor [Paenibacillus sp. FSL H8-0548]
MTTVITSARAPQFPLPFSHAVQAGDFVYVAGQVGVNPETLEPVGGIEEQTAQCIRNIEVILQEVGLSLEHIVKVTTHLSQLEDQAAYNEVYAKLITKPYPARITVFSGLGPYLIEMEVMAYAPSKRE